MGGNDFFQLKGVMGACGQVKAFMGFSPAALLHSISFADVLDEESGKGYQRRFTDKHSLDFSKYILTEGATTVPLAFNLRPSDGNRWKLEEDGAYATLFIKKGNGGVLSQVDCQHRLGYLKDIDLPLAFMVFIGLSEEEEMRVFSTINGKAKGLSSSLLDFHDAKLAQDLGRERPELFISLSLNDDKRSPWLKRLDLGGKQVSGISRRASLRTMQKAVKKFLSDTQILRHNSPQGAFEVLLYFWLAIVVLLEEEWDNPRKHFLTKGIGVYSLTAIAGDLWAEAQRAGVVVSKEYFARELSEFVCNIDWSSTGPLKGLGGQSGVQEAIGYIREVRVKSSLKVVAS